MLKNYCLEAQRISRDYTDRLPYSRKKLKIKRRKKILLMEKKVQTYISVRLLNFPSSLGKTPVKPFEAITLNKGR